MSLLQVKQTLTLQGQATPPSSKSQSIRALLFALLATGESRLTNTLASDDLNDALHVCRDLGARITVVDDQLIIHSPGLGLINAPITLNTGNSGITTRFILPLLGLRKNTSSAIRVDCGEQMRGRLIRSLIEALRTLGLSINHPVSDGLFPLVITGALRGGSAEVEGLTSQYLSALLISLPCASQNSIITVRDLHERPYVEMTLRWLEQQRIVFNHQRQKHCDIFHIAGKQSYQPFAITIAGDFSSASYLLAAAVLCHGQVELLGLNFDDPQGDKRMIPILQSMGADIVIKDHAVIIRGGKALSGLCIDANDIPDLVPTLAVIGCFATGKTMICNVAQARFKETDRIHSMTQGLTRLGARVKADVDGMTIHHSTLKGTQVHGYHDHRTVMALSIAGLLATGTTLIKDATAVNKTFPNFVSLMQSLGANMMLIND